MSTPSSSEKLRQKLNLRRYLDELAALVGRSVDADELSTLERATAIREEVGQKFGALPSQASEILFSERCSDRFNGFVQRLGNANSSSIYVWTPRTVSCGTLLVPSLATIKFSFDFGVNEEGILVFLSSDLEDRLLLDFSASPAGDQIMKIETQGTNWGGITY